MSIRDLLFGEKKKKLALEIDRATCPINCQLREKTKSSNLIDTLFYVPCLRLRYGDYSVRFGRTLTPFLSAYSLGK